MHYFRIYIMVAYVVYSFNASMIGSGVGAIVPDSRGCPGTKDEELEPQKKLKCEDGLASDTSNDLDTGKPGALNTLRCL
jgi:hypothetical protein